jgi:tyrosyl-tRNA synthetase
MSDSSIPTVAVSRADLLEGATLADLFVAAGLCSSRGDARRMASQGGLSMGDERLTSVDVPVSADLTTALLRAGKKRYMRVTIE